MENVKKSKTIFNEFRDDWVDEQGMLHTKIVKEVISGPINTRQAVQPINLNIPRPRFMMMRHPPIQQLRQAPQQQPAEVSQPQMPNMMDISKFMQMGKKFLNDSGINLKDLNLKDVLGGLTRKTSSGEEYEPDEKYNSYVVDKAAEAKAKEELDEIVVPETKPSKDKKEVNKWKKTKLKKQNQKKRKK